MTEFLAAATLVVFFILACLILPLTLVLIVWVKYRIIQAPLWQIKFPSLRWPRPAVNFPRIHITMGNGHDENAHICNYVTRYDGDYERLYCQCERWVQAKIRIPTNGNGQYELVLMPAITSKRADNDRDINAEAYQHKSKGKGKQQQQQSKGKGKHQQHSKGKGNKQQQRNSSKWQKIGDIASTSTSGITLVDQAIDIPDSATIQSGKHNTTTDKQYPIADGQHIAFPDAVNLLVIGKALMLRP